MTTRKIDTTKTKKAVKKPSAAKVVKASIDVLEQHDGFEVIRQDGTFFLRTADGGTVDQSLLKSALRYACNNHYGRDGAKLEYLIHAGSRLQDGFNRYDIDSETLDSVRSVLAKYALEIDKDARARIDRGLVEFGDIMCMFPAGAEVTFQHCGDLAGGVVSQNNLLQGFLGSYYEIEVKMISNFSGHVSEAPADTVRIWAYSGTRSTSDLPLRQMTPAAKATLTERGKKYRQYVSGASYVQYDGSMFRKGWFGSRYESRAEGRAMFDIKAARRMDPDYFQSYDAEEESHMDIIPDDKLWMCSPIVYGFSFAAKQWGEFRVSQASDIRFRTDAFDKLVMDPAKKKMVRALVEHSGTGLTDVIDGKGGGCIFLMHGPPGVGKTLTAEAVAEVLKRPLYSVSVGELGTDPSDLEKALRQILDVSTLWNAVVLLDEADIFLEERDEQNILRNAMVGIFLRLLEYHQGVMFLTTNRVRRFDRAFHSRISMALHYPDMTRETREKIWSNLLRSAGIAGVDIKPLAELAINGRQIKNTIRLAQTIAKADGRAVTTDDLHETIAIAQQFEKDLQN